MTDTTPTVSIHKPREITPATLPSQRENRKMDATVFTAERLIKKRRRKGKIQFLVKWKGYSNKYNSWEPVRNILDKSLIAEFNKRIFQTSGGFFLPTQKNEDEGEESCTDVSMEKEFFPKVDQEQPTEQNSLDGPNVTIIKNDDGGRHASDVNIPDIGTESFQPTASELHSVADMNFADSDSGRSHAVWNEDKESDGREVSREEEVVPKAWDQKQDSAGAGDINKSSEETMPGDEEYGDIYEECGDIYEEHSDISSEDEWKPEKKKADRSSFQRKSDSTSDEESSDISIERSRPRQKQTGDTLQRKRRSQSYSPHRHRNQHSTFENRTAADREVGPSVSVEDKCPEVGPSVTVEDNCPDQRFFGLNTSVKRRKSCRQRAKAENCKRNRKKIHCCITGCPGYVVNLARHFQQVHADIPRFEAHKLLQKRKKQPKRSYAVVRCSIQGCTWKGTRPDKHLVSKTHNFEKEHAKQVAKRIRLTQPERVTVQGKNLLTARSLSEQFLEWFQSRTKDTLRGVLTKKNPPPLKYRTNIANGSLH